MSPNVQHYTSVLSCYARADRSSTSRWQQALVRARVRARARVRVRVRARVRRVRVRCHAACT